MKIKWILESFVWEDGSIERFENSCKLFPYIEVIKISPEDARNGMEKLGNIEECVVFYGSLETAKGVVKSKAWIPGTYYNVKNYNCSSYYPHFGKYCLNGDNYCLLPYGDLLRHKEFLFNTFGQDNTIFIRPDRGEKEFTGKIVHKEEFELEVERAGFYEVPANSLVLISGPKNIEKEWRFFIVDKKVITGSLYKVGRNSFHSKEIDPKALSLAQEIVSSPYEPDKCWVLDICQTKSGNYYLLEIGCFSCSGIYACDTDIIVDEVSKVAWKEFQSYSCGG